MDSLSGVTALCALQRTATAAASSDNATHGHQPNRVCGKQSPRISQFYAKSVSCRDLARRITAPPRVPVRYLQVQDDGLTGLRRPGAVRPGGHDSVVTPTANLLANQ